MKKYFLFLLIMVMGCEWDQWVQPADQEEEMGVIEGKTDIFRVTIGTGSFDCGLPTLLFSVEDSVRISKLTGERGRTYMTYHLEPEFNQPGRRAIVNVRNPRDNKWVVCSAMGPVFPMVFVIHAAWEK